MFKKNNKLTLVEIKVDFIILFSTNSTITMMVKLKS